MPFASPQPVQVYSGFDYVTVDEQRRRVYAAHTASRALTIVDADTGQVIAQVRVGETPHGVAVDPASGHVYVGAGPSVVEVDPQAQKIVRTVTVDAPVDAVAYDPGNGHIYADEDDGTRLFAIDAHAFQVWKTITLPGHKPEYLAVDPTTHAVYQNIDNLGEFVIVDGTAGHVAQVVPTPELAHNHPLQFDPGYRQVIVAGSNGTLSVYDATGKRLGSTPVPEHIDQCSIDTATHLMACAGGGKLTVVLDRQGQPPSVVDQIDVPPGTHTVGADAKTGRFWIVWAGKDGDFVQGFAERSP
ncbi:MAG: YncE family protein [Candidatus Eremiobacteraeota bacterium]|nr:YncE family protein [Candidatus Eremiobacteraeota bacterium]